MNDNLDWIPEQVRQAIEDKTPVAPLVLDPFALLDGMLSVDEPASSVVSLHGVVVADLKGKQFPAVASKTACYAAP